MIRDWWSAVAVVATWAVLLGLAAALIVVAAL